MVRVLSGVLFCLLTVHCSLLTASAQTSSFTYQGKLADSGVAANGTYDITFKLYDTLANGTQIGTDIVRDNVVVSDGGFTVDLDFGAAAFGSGASRFLQLEVRPGASVGTFTTLVPRQPLTSSPYAVKAASATSSDSLTAACALCVTDAHIFSISGGKISANSITADKFANDSVTEVAIRDGNVTTSKIADAAVTNSKLAAGAVDATQLADNSVTAAKIASGAVKTEDLADSSVTAPKIVDASVTTPKLADGAVTSSKLAPDSVNAAHLTPLSITSTALGDGSVLTNKISDGAVTTGKLADGSVTQAKLSAGFLPITQVITSLFVPSGEVGTAIANCPVSHPRVVGGGFSLNFEEMKLLWSRPQDEGWSVRVRNSFPGSAGLIAYAICVGP